jgi:Family of unknown function (DUF6118)
VTLDLSEEESEVQAKPEPATVEQVAIAETEADPAAEAFARLEGEMALVRRAVQHLAAERADIVIPDYGKTLGGIAKQIDAISGSLGQIAEHPSMQMTPEHFGARMEAVALVARRADHESIEQARKDSRQTTQDLRTILAQVSTANEQRRLLWQGIGGGALAGILLWSFLPGTIVRAVPASWHWPERMATRMMDESSRWDAGARLMLTDRRQAWSALVEAADMMRDNRDAIEACRKSALKSSQPVRCTVKIRVANEPHI